MFGTGTGQLQVFARDSINYAGAGDIKYLESRPMPGFSELWKKSGDQTNKWHKATIDLSKYAGKAITLWLMGTTGINDKSDIAIDDVTIFSGGAKPTAPAPTPAPMKLKTVQLAGSRSCPASSKFLGRFMGRRGLETCAKTVAAFGGKYFQFGKSCKTGACYVSWSVNDTCPHGRYSWSKKGLKWSRMYNFYKVEGPAPAPTAAPTPAPTAAPTPAPSAPTVAPTVAPGAVAAMNRIDTDNSGTITRAEWDKAVADGIITIPGAGGRPAPTSAPTPATTQAPTSAPTPAPSSATFDRIDTDKSGGIKNDELNKAVANGILKMPRLT